MLSLSLSLHATSANNSAALAVRTPALASGILPWATSPHRCNFAVVLSVSSSKYLRAACRNAAWLASGRHLVIHLRGSDGIVHPSLAALISWSLCTMPGLAMQSSPFVLRPGGATTSSQRDRIPSVQHVIVDQQVQPALLGAQVACARGQAHKLSSSRLVIHFLPALFSSSVIWLPWNMSCADCVPTQFMSPAMMFSPSHPHRRSMTSLLAAALANVQNPRQSVCRAMYVSLYVYLGNRSRGTVWALWETRVE